MRTQASWKLDSLNLQAPEMVRVPLEELVLQIHLLGLGPAEAFVAGVLEPPPPKAVTAAVAALQVVGALDCAERLTPLGPCLKPRSVRYHAVCSGKRLMYAMGLQLQRRGPFCSGLEHECWQLLAEGFVNNQPAVGYQ